MLGQPIQWSHVTILARSHFRHAIRGGSGLIFLLVFLGIALGAAGIMIDPLKRRIKHAKEQVREQTGGKVELTDEKYLDMITSFARPVVAWLVGVEEEVDPSRRDEFGRPQIKKDPFVEHLIVERPPILSAYLMILCMFVPFTTCIASFNQLSGDIGTKGLRYLLLRTERINIIIARFLGTLLFSAVTSLGVILIVVTYIAMSFDTHSFGELLAWGMHGWMAVIVISLPYMCLSTWLSAMIDTPIATLFLCLMAAAIPVIGINLTQVVLDRYQHDMPWLDKLTPWGWKFELLHPSFGTMSLAILVNLAFAAAFGFLAIRHFLRRDL